MSVAEIIIQKENELRLLRSEAAFTIDADGAVVLEKSAEPETPYELAFTEEEVARLRSASGVVFTHNHPRGWDYEADDPRRAGSSFSPEDIHLACKAELAEIRAISPQFRFSMQPPPGGWNEAYWHLIETVYSTELERVRAEMGDEVLRGRLDARTYRTELLHRVWIRVANLLTLPYNRREE